MSTGSILTHRVPTPFVLEAVSSWLSRLALSQGCSMRELLHFLDLRRDVDLDLVLRGEALEELRRRCSLPFDAFGFAELVMDGFHYAKLNTSRLLTDQHEGPRFRYCPACIGRQGRAQGVMWIYWRFRDWRYCPVHLCLMEERCFRCRAQVRFPRDMASSQAGLDGYASQQRCQDCSADLSAAQAVRVHLFAPGQLSEREAVGLSAGRAFVATLGGEGLEDTCNLRPSLQRLMLTSALLPHPRQWRMTEARIRRQAALARGLPQP